MYMLGKRNVVVLKFCQSQEKCA